MPHQKSHAALGYCKTFREKFLEKAKKNLPASGTKNSTTSVSNHPIITKLTNYLGEFSACLKFVSDNDNVNCFMFQVSNMPS